jgi:hypothetical protein
MSLLDAKAQRGAKDAKEKSNEFLCVFARLRAFASKNPHAQSESRART